MDSYDTETDEYADYSGSTTLQKKVSFTPDFAMQVQGEKSNQIKSGKTYTGKYYIASKVNCTRYEKGYLGIVFGSDSEKYKNTTQVKDWIISNSKFTKLNKLKKTSPEAFFYWYKAIGM